MSDDEARNGEWSYRWGESAGVGEEVGGEDERREG